jgi:hypothetical protein
VRAAAPAALLAALIIPSPAGAASPCSHSLTGGVVARLCQKPATRSSARHTAVMHATGYKLSSTRGAAELRGSNPLRTGLSVKVSAIRYRGTQIALLYARGGRQWLVRFNRLKGRGTLHGKVVSHWKGRLQVRLHVGHRSIRPTSVRSQPAPAPAPPAPPRQHPMRMAEGGGGCAVPEAGYDNFFAMNGPGWTGGDGAFSVGLPDGRELWSFGDTYLGDLAPDGTRPITSPMVNNSMVVQTPSSALTLTGGTQEHPQALVSTGEPNSWYWPGMSAVENGRLVQFLIKMHRTGSGMWEFAYDGTFLATYSLPGIVLQGVSPVAASSSVMWGVWTLEDGGYTYIYGVEDVPWHKYLYVARVPQGQLSGQWEYYTGSTWSTDPGNSARLMDGVSDQFSVVKMGGGYQLVSQMPLTSDIYAYRATAPFGPFTDQKLLYTTPSWGSETYTYNAVAHPELTTAGGLLISFSVNTNNGAELLSNPEIYRPRFVRAASACFPG